MSNAGLIGPVIHRVYADIQVASRDRVQEIYERFGLRPGLERDFYFGLLARPMPAESLAAATIYSGVDGADEIKQGVAVIDSAGHWALTEAGRRLAAAVQGAVGEAAEELWNHGPVEIVPGLSLTRPAPLPRLVELTRRLLSAGVDTGGPVFRAVVPTYEPPAASPALRLTSHLGALRHHWEYAWRMAWEAAGLSVWEVCSLGDGPLRRAIEQETDRLHEPLYRILPLPERLELLAGLGALPFRVKRCLPTPPGSLAHRSPM